MAAGRYELYRSNVNDKFPAILSEEDRGRYSTFSEIPEVVVANLRMINSYSYVYATMYLKYVMADRLSDEVAIYIGQVCDPR